MTKSEMENRIAVLREYRLGKELTLKEIISAELLSTIMPLNPYRAQAPGKRLARPSPFRRHNQEKES